MEVITIYCQIQTLYALLQYICIVPHCHRRMERWKSKQYHRQGLHQNGEGHLSVKKRKGENDTVEDKRGVKYENMKFEDTNSNTEDNNEDEIKYDEEAVQYK